MLKLIRPQQWVKNLFVFFPMFFGGSLLCPDDIVAATITFVSFCLAASSIYCFNDIVDVEADRRHSVKCKRPIASGTVSIRKAYLLMAMLAVVSAATAALQENGILIFAVVAAYWIMNIAYCLWLKDYAVIDVCIIAFGFVLRILAGGTATGVYVSHWLVLMTFLLTLFLSFAKRRDDVLRMNATGEAPRKNTVRYNLTFINEAITITGSVTLVCYIMYTVSPEVVQHFDTSYLYLTSILVLIGLLRYIQLTVVDKKSGDPTRALLSDRLLQAIVVAWGLAFFTIIYLA